MYYKANGRRFEHSKEGLYQAESHALFVAKDSNKDIPIYVGSDSSDSPDMIRSFAFPDGGLQTGG